MSENNKGRVSLYLSDVQAIALHSAGLAFFVFISLVKMVNVLFCFCSLVVIAFIVINYFQWMEKRKKRSGLKKVFDGSESWLFVIALGGLFLWYVPYYPTSFNVKQDKEQQKAFVNEHLSKVVHQSFQEMPIENVFLADEDPSMKVGTETNSLSGMVIPLEWGRFTIKTFYSG
ncbi:MAG: hypothetical protein KKF78_09515 [Candidatus Omnitrophica bacterium]|nr:hypothetical protein [Candidatus Omnitrophota bacterium]MBU1997377.1 hypothetical protein [Candidatus Omnitrophota bacterium]